MKYNREKFLKKNNYNNTITDIRNIMTKANETNTKYQLFKLGFCNNLSEFENTEMKILDLIENLGYPMTELGTHFYKDIILTLYEYLKNVTKRRDMNKCKYLLKQLNDFFSYFYINIASKKENIELVSFHTYIVRAIEKIDVDCIDNQLAKKVYGKNTESLNYGLNAFQLASYVAGLYSYDDAKDYNKSFVKELSTVPNSFRIN